MDTAFPREPEILEDRTLLFTLATTWLEIGPNSITNDSSFGNAVGAVQAIAVDPNNAERVYVGAVNGGVWKTEHVSQIETIGRWEPLTDYETSLSISALAISPVNGNVIFAGTGDAGTFSLWVSRR